MHKYHTTMIGERIVPSLTSTAVGIFVPFIPSCLEAQSCSDVEVHLSNQEAQKRMQIAEHLAESLKMSVILELVYSDEDKPVFVPQEKVTLQEVVARIQPYRDVHCSIENNVVHIYDPSVLSSKNNALNYIFSGYQISPIADLFVTEFRLRLLHEAFRPENSTPYSGSSAGATGNDADRYTLIPELLLNTSARTVLLRAAREVPIIFAAEIPEDRGRDPQKEWKKTNAQLLFKVIRK